MCIHCWDNPRHVERIQKNVRDHDYTKSKDLHGIGIKWDLKGRRERRCHMQKEEQTQGIFKHELNSTVRRVLRMRICKELTVRWRKLTNSFPLGLISIRSDNKRYVQPRALREISDWRLPSGLMTKQHLSLLTCRRKQATLLVECILNPWQFHISISKCVLFVEQ